MARSTVRDVPLIPEFPVEFCTMLEALAPICDPVRLFRPQETEGRHSRPARNVGLDPDAALIAAVELALRASGYMALRQVEVELCAGVVVLWGRVPSYHQKQLAQAIAQRVEGVCSIANGLDVVCRR